MGEEYCWKKLVNEESRIPTEFDQYLFPLSDVDQIIHRVRDTLAKEPSKDKTHTIDVIPTIEKLTEAPDKFVPTLVFVLYTLYFSLINKYGSSHYQISHILHDEHYFLDAFINTGRQTNNNIYIKFFNHDEKRKYILAIFLFKKIHEFNLHIVLY
jgi:hypothetical protein